MFYMYACVCLCMWRPEINIVCLSQLSFILFSFSFSHECEGHVCGWARTRVDEHTHVCGWARARVWMSMHMYLPACGGLNLLSWGRVFYGTWVLLILLDWLTNELQEFSCLCLPSAGVKDVHCCAWWELTRVEWSHIPRPLPVNFCKKLGWYSDNAPPEYEEQLGADAVQQTWVSWPTNMDGFPCIYTFFNFFFSNGL